MGASNFTVHGKGKTAQEAFDQLTAAYRHHYGHGGYTGTIAEKRTFAMITVPAGWELMNYVEHLFDVRDPRIDDKWGPAGCVDLGGDEYLFFGWASE